MLLARTELGVSAATRTVSWLSGAPERTHGRVVLILHSPFLATSDEHVREFLHAIAALDSGRGLSPLQQWNVLACGSISGSWKRVTSG